jgi:hypothetical protein
MGKKPIHGVPEFSAINPIGKRMHASEPVEGLYEAYTFVLLYYP